MKKKQSLLLIAIISIFFSIKNVDAATARIFANKTIAQVGESVTVTVSYFACTWNLTVSGEANDKIVGADMNGNVSGSQSYTITSSTPRTIVVSFSGDVSDYDTDVTSYPSGSVSITFISPQPSPSPSVQPSPSPSVKPSPSPSNPTPTTQQPVNPITDQKSSNANLVSIKVDDYKLETTDNINFTLTVKNSVTNVNINAKAEDSKAKIEGEGNKVLKVGDNKIELKVTAENGATKSYFVIIKRKDSTYTLKDIDDALEEKGNIIVKIKDDETITKDVLDKIKKSNKKVTFTKTDDKNNELYSFIIEGSKITNTEDISSNISFKFLNQESFDKITGYRNGMYITTEHVNTFPKSTKLKISVSEKYKDGDQVYVYYFDEKSNKVTKISKKITVNNGIIEFDLEKGSKYFITKALIEDAKTEIKKDNDIFKMIALIEFLIISILILLIAIKKSSNKDNDNINTNPINNNLSNNNEQNQIKDIL